VIQGPAKQVQFQPLESRVLLAVATPSTGLEGVYYNDSNFGGTSVTRFDRAVDFSWSGSPASGVDAGTFSVRWTGRVKPTRSESYRFLVTSESSVRLWVGDQLVVDGWKSTASATIYKGSITLTAGTRYNLQLDLAHNTGPASVKLMWQTATLAKQTIPNRLLAPADQSLQNKINHAMAFARDQANRTAASLTPAQGYPDQTKADGTWNLTPAANWTSGYFGGVLWQLNRYFPNSGFDTKATTWTTPLADQKTQTGDHFSRLWDTFKPLYDKTGNGKYRQVLLDAAASKDAQFNATIGAFRTPEITSNSGNAKANFGLLMDQTMDLELLFWASDQTGNVTFRNHAITHLQTVISRMVRADGSVFQRFFFDSATGKAIGGENYQGYSNSSTWSRGQAWAVYSFSTIAQVTQRADFLAAAKKVANHFVSHLPSDGVPFWDFAAPGIPKTYRDSSAAAIATVGLLRLGKLSGDSTYTGAAQSLLSRLLTPKYLSEGTASRGILNHSALNVPKNKGNDVSLIFGDYYLLQAINAYTNRG
jgi:unsaturated chondroitin disaccharide hydrolase